MELSEVVNPHFAFPVVGVVLCAVLVFAFGFKSPVQPPSFDSFDEEKKPRRSKHKKKSGSGDHIENHVVERSAANKTTARTASAAKTPDKSPQPQKETKKVKKAAVKAAPAPVVAPEPKAESKSVSIDEGGWETVSVSKKKRNKPRKEVEPEPEVENWDDDILAPVMPREAPKVALSVYNEPALGSGDAPTAELQVPQPQPQRSKKTGKTRAKEVEPEAVAVNDMSDKENSPEPDTQRITDIIEEASKPIVKKEGKKSKSKAVAEPPDIVHTQSLGGSTAETKSKSKKVASKKDATSQNEADAAASKSAQQSSQSNSSATESKTVKSPKNKKDKHKKEASPPVVKESSGASLAETTSSPPARNATSPLVSQSKSTAQGVNVSEGKLTSQPVVPPASEAATTADNVTFDEMGDWQEAKPAKKQKKKARRDN